MGIAARLEAREDAILLAGPAAALERAPIALLVIWELASSLLPAAAPGYSVAGYWLIASVAAAGFLAALLVHELWPTR